MAEKIIKAISILLALFICVCLTNYYDRIRYKQPVQQVIINEVKEVPVEVIVEKYIKVYPRGRQFENAGGFKKKMDEYHASITYLAGTCVDVAMAYVEATRLQGYLVSTEALPEWHHMVVSTLTTKGEFWLYDPNDERYWLEWIK